MTYLSFFGYSNRYALSAELRDTSVFMNCFRHFAQNVFIPTVSLDIPVAIGAFVTIRYC